MAKEVAGLIKLQIKGGAANPSPPVGPALGAKGVNIMEFCKQFNARTQDMAGKITPVIITVYKDKSFDFVIKTTPVAIQLKEAAKINGPVYIRFGRASTPVIHENDEKLELGKAIQFGDGTDATVFATGIMVAEALKAKEELEKEGINIRVVDFHTIKPIDSEMIIKCAKETQKLISIEDHSVINGLGTAIADVLCEKLPTKLYKIGINDTFGESGKASDLLVKYGLTKQAIIEKVKNA